MQEVICSFYWSDLLFHIMAGSTLPIRQCPSTPAALCLTDREAATPFMVLKKSVPIWFILKPQDAMLSQGPHCPAAVQRQLGERERDRETLLMNMELFIGDVE